MNSITSKNAGKAFIPNGFTNWQDAGSKNRGFDEEFRFETHREAHERCFTIPDACGVFLLSYVLRSIKQGW